MGASGTKPFRESLRNRFAPAPRATSCFPRLEPALASAEGRHSGWRRSGGSGRERCLGVAARSIAASACVGSTGQHGGGDLQSPIRARAGGRTAPGRTCSCHRRRDCGGVGGAHSAIWGRHRCGPARAALQCQEDTASNGWRCRRNLCSQWRQGQCGRPTRAAR